MDKNTSSSSLNQRAAFIGIFMDFYTTFKSSRYYAEVLDSAETLYKQGSLLHREDYHYRDIKIILTYNLQAPYIAWDIHFESLGGWGFRVSKHEYYISWNGKTLMLKGKGSFALMTEAAFTELLTNTRRALRIYLEKKKIRVPILLRY